MINRDELLKMAREAGAFMKGTVHVHDGGTAFGFIQLDAFKDAILECAAVECDKLYKSTVHKTECADAEDAAKSIRALKTQGE